LKLTGHIAGANFPTRSYPRTVDALSASNITKKEEVIMITMFQWGMFQWGIQALINLLPAVQ
jgi:hypothetical protein